jgi:ribosomal protein L31E
MAKEFKEKTITVNLSEVYSKPATKRAINAKHKLKKAVTKETRLKELKISNKLNELLWEKGKYKAPRKLTIKIINEKNVGIIMLPGEKHEPKQEKKKEGKKTEEKKTTEKASEEKKGEKTSEAKKAETEKTPEEKKETAEQ